jgi:AcrR family transcriptional regulator
MDKEARRLQVKSVAREVFAERGYHQTKIEDIVTRAGIARGTFYLYFQDKRAVFQELLADFFSTLQRSIIRIDVSRDVTAQVRQNVRQVLQTLLDNRLVAKIMLSGAVGVDDEFDSQLLDFYGQVVDLIEASLRFGQGAGLIRPCNPRIAAFCMLGSIKEVMYHFVMERFVPSLDELVEELVAYNMQGFVTDLARTGAGGT